MGALLVASHPVHGERRFAFEGEANIGSAASSDLRLEPPVEEHHARMLLRDGRLIVVDLGTAGGTFVDGRRLVRATIVREGQSVMVGDWIVRPDTDDRASPPLPPRGPREQAMLEALIANPADDALRQVYGDWLEENGRAKEAEVLALEIAIRDGEGRVDDAELGRLGYRLRKLAGEVPFAWRAVVTRPRIESCPRAEVCPRSWDRLAPTPSLLFRSCPACRMQVQLVETMDLARRRVSQNERVAVDVALERYSRDLEVALARVPAPPATVSDGITALAFFSHDEPPGTVGSLLGSLNIVPPDDLGNSDMGFYTLLATPAAPLSPFVRFVSIRYHWDMVHEERKFHFVEITNTGYESFHLGITAGGDLVEGWLRRRFGTPREAGKFRVYGGHWLYEDGPEGGGTLRWEQRLPDWALAPTDKAATLLFLNEISRLLRREDCTHAVLADFGSRPPPRSGLVVVGPLNRDDFWLRFEPKLTAREVAHALEIADPIGSSGDVHMERWSLVERNPKSRLGYPRYGRWIIDVNIDGWPSGSEVPGRYAAKELGPRDLAHGLCIRRFDP